MLITISGILYVVGFIPYIYAILKGKATPNGPTWIVWTILDAVALVVELQHGTVSGTLIAGTIGAGIISTLAVIRGTTIWTRTELICMYMGLLGAVLVYINSSWALCVSASAMLIGTIPTWIQAWKNPASENRTAWIIYATGCVIGLVAVQEWSVAGALQPATFMVIDGSIAMIVMRRPRTS